MKLKKLIALLLTGIMMSLSPLTSFASGEMTTVDGKILASRIAAIENEVSKNIRLYDQTSLAKNKRVALINQSSVTFDNFSVKIDMNNLNNSHMEILSAMSDDELYAYIESVYVDAYSQYSQFISSDNEIQTSSTSSSSILSASETRNNDVWAGVPLIGHGYIRIRYTVSYSNNKFTSAEYENSWFTGGIAVGSYEERYGYTQLTTNNTIAEIYAVGSLTYGLEIKGLPTSITVDATFLYYDEKPY